MGADSPLIGSRCSTVHRSRRSSTLQPWHRNITSSGLLRVPDRRRQLPGCRRPHRRRISDGLTRRGGCRHMTRQAVRYQDSDIPLESEGSGCGGGRAARASGGVRARPVGEPAPASPPRRPARRLYTAACGDRPARPRPQRGDRRGVRTAGATTRATCWASRTPSGAPRRSQIIGQSSGAAIAMTCAQLEPSRVERLVLVDLGGESDQRSGVPGVACAAGSARCTRRRRRPSH